MYFLLFFTCVTMFSLRICVLFTLSSYNGTFFILFRIRADICHILLSVIFDKLYKKKKKELFICILYQTVFFFIFSIHGTLNVHGGFFFSTFYFIFFKVFFVSKRNIDLVEKWKLNVNFFFENSWVTIREKRCKNLNIEHFKKFIVHGKLFEKYFISLHLLDLLKFWNNELNLLLSSN